MAITDSCHFVLREADLFKICCVLLRESDSATYRTRCNRFCAIKKPPRHTSRANLRRVLAQQSCIVIKLDVLSDASAEAAVGHVLTDAGRLDVVVHNAGHMVYGPAEAFTPSLLAEQYDVNVLGTQRVNRAALPPMRGRGLLEAMTLPSLHVAGIARRVGRRRRAK